MSTAPYPANTRAKGWRFEIDHERIRQSDTWAIAPADVRPWLLMLWMVAWEQTPCGSLPADDSLIAARIGMSPKNFAKHRDILMRGWWAADDGRLYHDVICLRVGEMLNKRAKEAKRAADSRGNRAEAQATASAVTPESRVTHTGVTQQSDPSSTPSTKHQAPDSEDKSSERAPAKPTRATKKCPESFVVTQDMADWARDNFPAVSIVRETASFRDYTFSRAISDWAGAWRNWIRKASEFAKQSPAKATARQTEVAKWLGPLAKQGDIIDMEAGNGPRIALG